MKKTKQNTDNNSQKINNAKPETDDFDMRKEESDLDDIKKNTNTKSSVTIEIDENNSNFGNKDVTENQN
jgi:hypothetical protein